MRCSIALNECSVCMWTVQAGWGGGCGWWCVVIDWLYIWVRESEKQLLLSKRVDIGSALGLVAMKLQ